MWIVTKAYAELGDKSTTLDWLEKTFQAGLIYDRPIKKDLWLKVLNDDPKFIEMVDKMNKKVAKMRETLLSDNDIRQ